MSYLPFVIKIFISVLFGGALGWQRHHTGKAAGMRTFALVSLGSCFYTIMSTLAFPDDSSRIPSQILTGIGFLGAGTIIHKSGGVEGLTTAAGLWAVSAIGVAVGIGWYYQAAVATIIMFGILYIKEK